MNDHHAGHHPEAETYAALRTKAIESLLAEKGLISSDGIDLIVQKFEQDIGPMNGARVVARAWVDPEFKRALLENGTAAIAEMGYWGNQGSEIIVLENTPTVRNVVVCTLCSCYPWPVLGLPPTWYKSAPYRSRVVREPRAVLKEFGTMIGDDVDVRVWDSTAEVRYMVLPERPVGTEGMSQDELAQLVTRDSMIGVVEVACPALVS